MCCYRIRGASGAGGAMWAFNNGLFELVLMVMRGDKTLPDKTNANVKLNVSNQLLTESLPSTAFQRRMFSSPNSFRISFLLRYTPHNTVKHTSTPAPLQQTTGFTPAKIYWLLLCARGCKTLLPPTATPSTISLETAF